MAEQLRLPDISGSDKEQLTKIRSYLYQIIPQLNLALNNLGSLSSQAATPTSNVIFSSGARSSEGPAATFNAIKSLIIKSADIVDAFYEEISNRLEGVYVAQSDFGTYAEKTSQTITENATNTTQEFENIQGIIIDVDEDLQNSKDAIEDTKAQLQGSLDDLVVYATELGQAFIDVTAYLKSGLLYTTDEGIPVYGIEIGQSVKNEAGEEAFNKFSRFTSEKLSFYDSNGMEVAYISDKKLYIKMAQITISLQVGGLIQLVMTNGDVVEKWVGMGG